MSQIANASATSLNFIGFEDVNGQGMPQILYNQVFIEPNQSFTAGVGQIAAAGWNPVLLKAPPGGLVPVVRGPKPL